MTGIDWLSDDFLNAAGAYPKAHQKTWIRLLPLSGKKSLSRRLDLNSISGQKTGSAAHIVPFNGNLVFTQESILHFDKLFLFKIVSSKEHDQ